VAVARPAIGSKKTRYCPGRIVQAEFYKKQKEISRGPTGGVSGE